MTSKISCIIVDDEPKSIELIQDYITEMYSQLTIIGSYTTWNSALQGIREKASDLLFLDISMPGKTGMDLLNLLPGISSEVIFITAHSEFALSAFKFSPSGYILKPIDDAQFVSAVDKAIERIQFKKIATQPHATATVAPSVKIGIPNNKGIDYLLPNDILYVEALNNCTKVVTKEQEIICSYNLGKFKSILEKHSFYPNHRSYMVNLNCIIRYTASGGILMTNGAELPVSKNIKEDFLLHFDKVSRPQ